MRKIINSAFISLDGVTADPSSWAIFDPDAAEEAGQALSALGGMLMDEALTSTSPMSCPNRPGHTQTRST